MYYLQVFDIEADGRRVGVVQIGNPFETVASAAGEAWRLGRTTHYRVTSEGGSIICEDRIPDEMGRCAA
jgi:hypothetical protein